MRAFVSVVARDIDTEKNMEPTVLNVSKIVRIWPGECKLTIEFSSGIEPCRTLKLSQKSMERLLKEVLGSE